MNVVKFPSPQKKGTIKYKMPRWARKGVDVFVYLDLPFGPFNSRLIVHLCEYQTPTDLYVINVNNAVGVAYIEQISARRYRLIHPNQHTETRRIEEIAVLGRVIEAWLTPEGQFRWVFTEKREPGLEPARLEHLGSVLDKPTVEIRPKKSR